LLYKAWVGVQKKVKVHICSYHSMLLGGGGGL
jgi:hypothetical protein